MTHIARSRSRVVIVREKTKRSYVSGFGADAVFHDKKLGWELVLENGDHSAYTLLLDSKPDVQVGDYVLTTYEKEKRT